MWPPGAAANLSYYDSVRNVTYTDWRLPTTLQSGVSTGPVLSSHPIVRKGRGAHY